MGDGNWNAGRKETAPAMEASRRSGAPWPCQGAFLAVSFRRRYAHESAAPFHLSGCLARRMRTEGELA